MWYFTYENRKNTIFEFYQFFLKKWNNFFSGMYTVQDNIKSYSMLTASLCRTYKQLKIFKKGMLMKRMFHKVKNFGYNRVIVSNR